MAEWASDALVGLGKGAPFSLCLTEKHFSQVASAYGDNENHLSDVSRIDFDSFSLGCYSCSLKSITSVTFSLPPSS